MDDINHNAIIDDIAYQSSNNCEYVDLQEINIFTTSGYKHTVLHINIHSLMAKLDELKNIIYTLSEKNVVVDFILLCEMFLTDTKAQLCRIDGYTLTCNNRSNGRRGVAIFIRDSLTFKTRRDLEINVENEFETIFC